MDIELEFLKLAIDASKSNYQNYIHNAWSAIGFLSVVIGWILTSKESRKFLAAHTGLRRTILFAICGIAIVNISIFIELQMRSEILLSEIKQISPLKTQQGDAEFLTFYEIPFYWVVVDTLLNVILLTVLITLFFYLKRES